MLLNQPLLCLFAHIPEAAGSESEMQLSCSNQIIKKRYFTQTLGTIGSHQMPLNRNVSAVFNPSVSTLAWHCVIVGQTASLACLLSAPAEAESAASLFPNFLSALLIKKLMLWGPRATLNFFSSAAPRLSKDVWFEGSSGSVMDWTDRALSPIPFFSHCACWEQVERVTSLADRLLRSFKVRVPSGCPAAAERRQKQQLGFSCLYLSLSLQY